MSLSNQRVCWEEYKGQIELIKIIDAGWREYASYIYIKEEELEEMLKVLREKKRYDEKLK